MVSRLVLFTRMPEAKAHHAGGSGRSCPFISLFTTGYTAPFALADRLASKEFMSWSAVPQAVLVSDASSCLLRYDHEKTVSRHQEARMKPSQAQNFVSDQNEINVDSLVNLVPCSD